MEGGLTRRKKGNRRGAEGVIRGEGEGMRSTGRTARLQVALTLPVAALTSLAWQSTEPVRIRLPSWLVATQVRGPW